MSAPRVLVAGIGNIFLGDDAFGVEVVARLRTRPLPPRVRVVDFGIRALDLAFALERCEVAILVDAMARGGAPGTLYVLEPALGEGRASMSAGHTLTPDDVLQGLPRDARPRVLRVVGCEPARFEGEPGEMGLSAPVQGALDEAVALVEALVRELSKEGCDA